MRKYFKSGVFILSTIPFLFILYKKGEVNNFIITTNKLYTLQYFKRKLKNK